MFWWDRLVHPAKVKVDNPKAISYLIDLLLNVSKNRSIDFLPCWNEVHSSNMSKVCRNETEYAETEAFYALEQNIKLMAVQNGEYIIAKCAEDLYLKAKPFAKVKY